jgi:hypothetical protein
MAKKESGKVRILTDEKREYFTVIDKSGQSHKGTGVSRPVMCGKKCQGCPHKFYLSPLLCFWRKQGGVNTSVGRKKVRPAGNISGL